MYTVDIGGTSHIICFGWRLTPGYFDVHAQALQHAVRAAGPGTTVSATVRSIVDAHVRVTPPPAGTVIARARPDPAAQLLTLGCGSRCDVHYHVDNGLLADVREDVLLHISAVLVDVHLQAFGDHEPGLRPCPVSLSKLGDWSTCATALGFVIDTAAGTIALTPEKRAKLNTTIFADFTTTRATAPLREIRSLVGLLRHLATVVRPGRSFLWRLQRVCNQAQRDGACGRACVRLTAAFHADLAWWRWLVRRVQLMTVAIGMPLWGYVKRPPALTALSEASRWGMGGYCAALSMWWQLALPPDLKRAYNHAGDGGDALRVNELELAAMFINAWAALVLARGATRDDVAGNAVLLLGDNQSAVHWLRQAYVARRTRTAAPFIRALGALEITCAVSFSAAHIAGVRNGIADWMSRGAVTDPRHALSSPVPAAWTRLDIPQAVLSTVFETLRGRYSEEPWQHLPGLSTSHIGAAGPTGVGSPACPST
jgi:hypothetical protein